MFKKPSNAFVLSGVGPLLSIQITIIVSELEYIIPRSQAAVNRYSSSIYIMEPSWDIPSAPMGTVRPTMPHTPA